MTPGMCSAALSLVVSAVAAASGLHADEPAAVLFALGFGAFGINECLAGIPCVKRFAGAAAPACGTTDAHPDRFLRSAPKSKPMVLMARG